MTKISKSTKTKNRYENVDYPELTFEEANAGWDDQYIDDEYLITHQIENWRRIDLLTEPLTQSVCFILYYPHFLCSFMVPSLIHYLTIIVSLFHPSYFISFKLFLFFTKNFTFSLNFHPFPSKTRTPFQKS